MAVSSRIHNNVVDSWVNERILKWKHSANEHKRELTLSEHTQTIAHMLAYNIATHVFHSTRLKLCVWTKMWPIYFECIAVYLCIVVSPSPLNGFHACANSAHCFTVVDNGYRSFIFVVVSSDLEFITKKKNKPTKEQAMS